MLALEGNRELWQEINVTNSSRFCCASFGVIFDIFCRLQIFEAFVGFVSRAEKYLAVVNQKDVGSYALLIG